ncbi:MAG: 30S ribosomal protein S6 [Gammaproteobacteria bacterium]|jgi:small subunit ribosomal protein S6|nr:30S ribosomal protein S6 [Gammaproteobacteria bacterium]
MRHYEIVLLVHPDQSEQVPSMLERYRALVENNGGKVHRSEDWGRLQLAFTIAKLHKAHYLMLNVECDAATLEELEGIFRFNDAILRHLTVRKDEAETEPSIMMQRKENKDDREKSRRAPRDSDDSDDSDEDDGDDDAESDDDSNEKDEKAEA